MIWFDLHLVECVVSLGFKNSLKVPLILWNLPFWVHTFQWWKGILYSSPRDSTINTVVEDPLHGIIVIIFREDPLPVQPSTFPPYQSDKRLNNTAADLHLLYYGYLLWQDHWAILIKLNFRNTMYFGSELEWICWYWLSYIFCSWSRGPGSTTWISLIQRVSWSGSQGSFWRQSNSARRCISLDTFHRATRIAYRLGARTTVVWSNGLLTLLDLFSSLRPHNHQRLWLLTFFPGPGSVRLSRVSSSDTRTTTTYRFSTTGPGSRSTSLT